MVTRERTFTSYADPDNPDDVAPEMMIQAYPYGPANIPVQEDVKALMASKYDKGMKIFGFTPLETVPQWYGMEEARILVPWPTREARRRRAWRRRRASPIATREKRRRQCPRWRARCNARASPR